MIKVLLPARGGRLLFVTESGCQALIGDPVTLSQDLTTIIEEDAVTVKAIVFEKEWDEDTLAQTWVLGQLPVNCRPIGATIYYSSVDGGIEDFELGLDADNDAFIPITFYQSSIPFHKEMEATSAAFNQLFTGEEEVTLTMVGDMNSVLTVHKMKVVILYLSV